MADQNGAPAAEPVSPKLNILGQFIRDMSFENVAAQKGSQGNMVPDVSVGVNLDARKRGDAGQYEVIVKLNIGAKAKEGGAQIFVLELEYAGVFTIENVPDDQLHPFLLIECPRQLFPFLRRIVHDVTRDGGYPPLNLENIDFLALYRTELNRRMAESKAN